MSLNQAFIFPFDQVEKGSNIILYGIGVVGKSFYNQITTLNYCNIVAVAVTEYNFSFPTRYPIILPNEIKNYSYDYIVIAVAPAGTARQIKKTLLEHQVEERKIIYAPNRRVTLNLASTDLSQWLSSLETLEQEMHRYMLNRTGHVSYFDDIILHIRALVAAGKQKEVEEIKTFFKSYLHSDCSIKNKIVILRILYSADCFDPELMELLLSYVRMVDNYNARLWLLQDISVIERNMADVRYAGYYVDKRRIMEETVRHYYDQPGCKKVAHTANKIALIAFTLGSEYFSHNQLIVPYANEMVKMGREVAVFPMDLLRYRYGESFIQPMNQTEQDSRVFEEIHQELFDPKVKIIYNNGESIEERISNFMENLRGYDPDVVYDCCGEYSYLSPLFHKFYFTIALPMRGYATSSCFDVYMCRNKELCIKENTYFHSVKEEQMVEALVGSKEKQITEAFCREEYGIPEDAFVITTVGDRLIKELTINFVDRVCDFLTQYENACWIIVGSRANDYAKDRYAELFLKNKIIEWGFEKNLSAFYALCDVYWNPDRMGGGGSIAMAMRCGVPVVTTRFPSDILPRLGLKNAVDGDYEDCKRYVEKLYHDKSFYQEISELMKERMKSSSVTEYVKKLLEVVEGKF